MRKICLFSLVLLCFQLGFAQDGEVEQNPYYYDFMANYPDENQPKRFKTSEKQFNDWYVSIFGGVNLLHSSDLNSWGKMFPKKDSNEFWEFGWDVQAQVMKEMNHAFSFGVMGQYGNTRQIARNAYHLGVTDDWYGETEYWGISLMGDLNLSQLLRRVDNFSRMRWALHAYAGAGFIHYEAKRRARHGGYEWTYDTNSSDPNAVGHGDFGINSFFAQVGAGLRHKINRRIDVELRTMWVFTGDEQFDGSGRYAALNEESLPGLHPDHDDNFLTTSLGLHFKLGKHKESLQWYVPVMAGGLGGPCIDSDNDGVCDQNDKCPDTPAGVRVDGAGCPLDVDGDGIPDYLDDCPTIPGPVDNQGCPRPIIQVSAGQVASDLSNAIAGIKFHFDRDVIRPESYSKLDHAANILKSHPDYKFTVEGHTDDAGSVAYNQGLSQRRAQSVVRYLTGKGVPASQLVPVGKGKSELKHPECRPTSKCPEWKNFENRRVIFKPAGEAVPGLEYTTDVY